MAARYTLCLGLVVTLCIPTSASSQTGHVLKLDRDLVADDVQLGDVVPLCLRLPETAPRDGCDFKKDFAVGSDRLVRVEDVCQAIERESAKISRTKLWDVAGGLEPAKTLYRIDCRHPPSLKKEYGGFWKGGKKDPKQSPPPPTSPPRSSPPRSSPSPSSAGSGSLDRQILQRLDVIESLILDLEPSRPSSQGATAAELRALAEQQRNQSQQIADLETRLVGLLHSLSEEVHSRPALPAQRRLEISESRPSVCQRSDHTYEGAPEVLVSIHDTMLRFIRIEPRGEEVVIGYEEEQARAFYDQARQDTTQSIQPWIFRSVPAVSRRIEPFFIQERLIEPELYSTILEDGDARRVSFKDVELFISRLNELCMGQARFALPSEEEFVEVAKQFYLPAERGMRTCKAMQWAGFLSKTVSVSRMLGHYWQLTRSPCEPFADSADVRCEPETYVKKGGSHASQSALECLPEYRAEASYDVAQVNTTFRLVLVE